MEELLTKYFSKNATDDEISLVESWRGETKENANVFFTAKMIWNASESKPVDGGQVLASILESESIVEPIGKQNFLYAGWVKYAAAAVLVLAIGLIAILNNQSGTSLNTEQSLADGTKITLQSNAHVDILAFNESRREIKLEEGKAYFDVERDESRPFIIHTSNATVKVLGTSFVVYTGQGETRVQVESGLVELSKNEVTVAISKGETGIVDEINKGIIKKDNDDLNYLAWKTKILTFKNDKMMDVKEVLEEVYGIEVKFDNADFSNCLLTAKFNKKKPKDAIEIIAKTFDMKFEFKDGVAILKGKGC